MENEPDKPTSSSPPLPDLPPPQPPSATPPPPDLSAPPSSSPPPPPDFAPPPPPMAPPPQMSRTEPKSEAAKFDSDEEEEGPKAGADAAFETRVIAAIIDTFVAAGISMMVGMLAAKLGTIAAFAYVLTRDALPFLEGQSIGKKIMKLKAVKPDGKSLSGDWQSSVVRNIPLAIPFFGLVELYMLYSRKDKGGTLLRFGDEWAKTKVIVAKEPSAL